MRSSLLALVLLATALSLRAQDYPPAFPRKNVTKLFENDRMAVWDMVWPKGEPSPLHRHVYDQVGTYYQEGARAITPLNGPPSQNVTPVGRISTTRKGTTHVEEGTSDPPLRAVFIELKKSDPQSTDRSVTPPIEGAKQVHAEDRVTAWDFTWSRIGSTAKIRYQREAVVVWLTPGTLRVTPDRGAAQIVNVKPGTFWHRAAGTAETEELTGGSPRAIIFEFN
jgi:hypothetical protein